MEFLELERMLRLKVGQGEIGREKWTRDRERVVGLP